MTTTIRDIALQAGVSIATVSRALNGKNGVGPETRERILEIGRCSNYYPNLQARGLVARKPYAIGIVIPRTSEFAFSNPYYAEILKGIGEKARESGLYLVFSIAGEESYARMYHQKLAAGIIVLANRIGDPRIEEAWQMKVPIMLIPGDPSKPHLASVDVDNVDGTLKSVEFLANLGHRQIAFITGTMDSKYGIERLTAYCKALKKGGLPFQKNLVLESDFTQEGVYSEMKKLLSMEHPPTAVLVPNDYSAMGALRAAKEMGFRVPKDISIMGFGDVPFASMTDPPLTTVRESFQEMGRVATDRLLKIINGKGLSKKHLILPVELVIRESTGPPLYRRHKVR